VNALTDAGARASDRESGLSTGHHDALRLWLRLLTCTTLIEAGIRARLREQFSTTLPRFDLMAQLERNPDGLRMGELSRRMMVTGGNVTGITTALVAEGLVERRSIAGDRRARAVFLTPAGRRAFSAMASLHERWVEEMVGGLVATDRNRLHGLLGRLKLSVSQQGRPAANPRAAKGGRR
jgi:DNA-binding MarR family transcriptional regulator